MSGRQSRGALLALLLAFVAGGAAFPSDQGSQEGKKYGDKCELTSQCDYHGGVCDPHKRTCQCTADLPITNHFDMCGKQASINESCMFSGQCETVNHQTECKDGRCTCKYEMTPLFKEDGSTECITGNEPPSSMQYIDPAMIGVLVGMALMFVIICVVLRLFSRARWRENRTIFNTPNPRLMNVSLLKDSKLLHGQERRGSRAPSRAPSVSSLRPHSPQANQAGRRSSRASSNASAASSHSNKSPTKNQNLTSPILGSVTIEVQEPKA